MRLTPISLIWSALVSTTMLVAGCGGGGGSEDQTPKENPTLFGTLSINDGNADTIAFAVSIAEGALSLAQAAANEIVVFSTPAGLAFSTCQHGGSLSISHDDRDVSFSVSAGDVITLDFSDCYRETVDGIVSGKIELEITSYQISGMDIGLNASMTIGSPLRVVDQFNSALVVDVTASADIEFSLNVEERLVVSGSDQQFVEFVIDDNLERINDFRLAKNSTANFDGSNLSDIDTSITLDLFYDSEFLGGTVSCDTTGLFAFSGGNVDSANVLCRGRNRSAVRISNRDEVRIDPEGDDTFILLGTLDWNTVIDGFLSANSDLRLVNLLGDIPTARVQVVATDLFFDAARNRLLVTTAADDPISPNSLIAVSLVANTREVLASFAREPSAVAQSADGTLVYVGYTGQDEVSRYQADTMQLLSTVAIASNDSASSTYGVLDLAVSPNDKNLVAVSFNYVGTAVDDVAVFLNDEQLPGRYRNLPDGNSSAGERIQFSQDGTKIHSYHQPPPANSGAVDLVVDDVDGVTAVNEFVRYGSDMDLANGRIYSHGYEYDAETYVRLGSFGWGVREMAVDAANDRIYSEHFDRLEVWSLDRRLPIATYALGVGTNTVQRLLMAGDFLVMATDGDLRVLNTSVVEAIDDEGCVVQSAQTVEGDAYTQYACDIIDAVFDAQNDLIYAAVTNEVPGNGNSIAVINDGTQSVETYIPVPSNPKSLALSGDGSRLYVTFAEVELIVAIDTATRTIADTWQIGVLIPRDGYLELDPRIVLQLEAAPVEQNTVIATVGRAVNSEKTFVAFRNGGRLTDELNASELTANTSLPYPRIVFDDLGAVYALHAKSVEPYLETLLLTSNGITTSGVSFDATGALWWPYWVSGKGSEVYFTSGDVVNIANQTTERRFDYTLQPFSDVNAPVAVYADPNSDDVWFVSESSVERTGLVRYDNRDGSLIGADEFNYVRWGRNREYSHQSIFNVGTGKLGLVIDERQGVLVIDKSAIE